MRNLLLVGCLVLAGCQPPQSGPPVTKPVPGPIVVEPTKPEDETFDARLVAMHNKIREDQKLSTLISDSQLHVLASRHASWMAREQVLSHGSGETSFSMRLKLSVVRFKSAGENIAVGRGLPEDTMQRWWNSPPHKANMVKPAFSSIGVGHAFDERGNIYYCVIFADLGTTAAAESDPELTTPDGVEVE